MTTCKECGQPTPATSVSAGVVEPVAWQYVDKKTKQASGWPTTCEPSAKDIANYRPLYTHPPVEVDGLLRRALEALSGMAALDEADHQRGGDDEDISPEVCAAYDAIAALRQHLSANSKGG